MPKTYPSSYWCYEPQAFELLCAILRRREVERAHQRYAEADALRAVLETSQLHVHDAPHGTCFSHNLVTGPVAPWALFFDVADAVGTDVAFAGPQSRWAGQE